MKNIIVSDCEVFSLSLDSSVYSLSVIQKSCYALMHLFSVNISRYENNFLLKIQPLSSDLSSKELEGLLLDELLDYSLREKISEKTEGVRNLILANAFSKTKLIG
jgi:His-Xaa-Ser system protein HxsD